ncbi:MAG: arylesterase [Notoacmeibacter sp.]
MGFKALIRVVIQFGWWLGFFLVTAISVASAEPTRIVAFGDSLSAGYELPENEGFPKQLEAALKAKGFDVIVENSSVSGDTSTGGLERLDWSIADGTDLVILELGANDALRGIDPQLTRTNIDAMIKRLKERNIKVVLAGMLSPPNMGETYAKPFNAIYPELAAQYEIALYPFFMDGVITEPSLKLSDGLHPNGKGVAVIVAGILPVIEAELQK